MIKLRELNLRTIRKMTMRNRLQAINEVNRSALSFTMFSMMTPTQFAELFPRYYREHNPDIQGFMNALPTSLTAAQQKAREQQLAQTASGSAAGSDFNARGYVQEYKDQMTRERSAHVGGRGGRGGPPPATLSPEQDKAFSYVQSGDMDVGSDIMKNNLGKLSTEELSSIGIRKITKEGKEYYHYDKPEMTDEQATARLKEGGGGGSREAEAMNFFMSKGWTKNQAAAIVGNLKVESINFKESVINGTQRGDLNFGDRGAIGIAQWRKDRIDRFEEVYHKPLVGASFREQLDYVNWELHNHKKSVGDALRNTDDPAAAAELLDKRYEISDGQARGQRMRYAEQLSNTSYSTKPEGDNGQYSRAQLDKMKEQYANEQNQSQRQKYAEILRSHGVNPDAGQSVDVATSTNKNATWTSKGGFIQPVDQGLYSEGNFSQCATLGKAFNPNVGRASEWAGKVHQVGASSIRPGLMLATTSYNSSTGKEGTNTHVVMALTRPDADGNFYTLEQWRTGGSAVISKKNVNGYKGTPWGVVEGTQISRQASEAALSGKFPGLTQEARESITNGLHEIDGHTAQSTPEQQAPVTHPSQTRAEGSQASDNPVSSAGQKKKSSELSKVPEGAHVTFNQKTGTPEQKTQTKVTVSEKKPESPKPEPPKPEAPKPPEGSHVTTDVKSNRVEQKPEVKKTVTPPEKKAEVKPTPEAPKPAETAKVEPPKPEPQKVAEAKPTEKPKTPVPTAAKGGKFNADADTLRIEPIGGLTKDGMTDTAVLMSGDRPVSTLNPNRETVTTKNNQVSIQPVGKESKLNPPPQPQNSTPDNLATAPVPKPQATPNRAPDNSRDATMVNDLLEMSKPIFRNVSSMRAFSRANFEETGSAIDWNHHSLGTPNLK